MPQSVIRLVGTIQPEQDDEWAMMTRDDVVAQITNSERGYVSMSPIPSAASLGLEAIHAAGLAVNALDLDDTGRLRRAIPLARQAAVAVKSRSESTDWKIGRFTGLPIAIYQNWLYEHNREWHFTDGTLCVLWCVEFPDAKSDYPEKRHYIASTRRDYNSGRHQADAPATLCVGYDRNGRATETGASLTPRTASPVQRPGTPFSPVSALSVSNKEEAPLTAGGTGSPSARQSPKRMVVSSHPDATARRVRALDAYMSAHVLDKRRFLCSTGAQCRGSHSGDFFEGQLHHVGTHYDISLGGSAFRVVVVGQDTGMAHRASREKLVRRTWWC